MSIKTVFDNYAAFYDGARRKLIPCFEDFYRVAAETVPFPSHTQIRVLDLGAGTGLLTEMVAAAYPGAAITLIDVAGRMLNRARERLKLYGTRFEFIEDDYAVKPIEGRYDVIMSALSIHHLSGPEKCRLFSLCHAALLPGGIFINADQVKGHTAAIEERYREIWIRQARANGLTESELQAAIERMKEDRMSTLSFQLAALEEEGYDHVNCWYRNYSFAVYSGSKR
jgi:tRNA (cmo5U34)-methyltransferase